MGLEADAGTIVKIAGDAGGCDDNSDASEDGRMGIEGDAGGGDAGYGDGSGGVGGNKSEEKRKKKKRGSRGGKQQRPSSSQRNVFFRAHDGDGK
jgi:hypothetical protein